MKVELPKIKIDPPENHKWGKAETKRCEFGDVIYKAGTWRKVKSKLYEPYIMCSPKRTHHNSGIPINLSDIPPEMVENYRHIEYLGQGCEEGIPLTDGADGLIAIWENGKKWITGSYTGTGQQSHYCLVWLKKPQLILEIGKRYVMRNGKITEPLIKNNHKSFPLRDRGNSWTGEGRIWASDNSSPYDIIKEYIEPALAIDQNNVALLLGGNCPLTETVMRITREHLTYGCDPPREINLTPTTDIMVELGADSLDQLELLMIIEGEFDVSIPEKHAEEFKTVKSIVDYLSNTKK